MADEALQPENENGDVQTTPVTAVKQSDGEVRRMTLDDLDRLRTNAMPSMDAEGKTLKEFLTDLQDFMEDILLELRYLNLQFREAHETTATRDDV